VKIVLLNLVQLQEEMFEADLEDVVRRLYPKRWERFAKRSEAMRLLGQGQSATSVADKLGVSKFAVREWSRRRLGPKVSVPGILQALNAWSSHISPEWALYVGAFDAEGAKTVYKCVRIGAKDKGMLHAFGKFLRRLGFDRPRVIEDKCGLTVMAFYDSRLSHAFHAVRLVVRRLAARDAQFARFYLRGFIWGDGSAFVCSRRRRRKCGIATTKEAHISIAPSAAQLSWVTEPLRVLRIGHVVSRSSSPNAWNVQVNAKSELEKAVTMGLLRCIPDREAKIGRFLAGYRPQRNRRFTVGEDEYIVQNFREKPLKEIAAKLERSRASVHFRIIQLRRAKIIGRKR
jgi:hypothetical protein